MGDVELGAHFPFWLRRGSSGRRGLRLAGALAAANRSRFDLQSNQNEFIETHFRVGFRLKARLRAVEGRLEIYHVSSHLGDEFLERTGRAPISTSREGLELLIRLGPAPGLTLYGGPGLLVRSTESLEPLSLRGGLEWVSAEARWGPFVPYAGLEAFAWEEVDWDPRLALEAGVSFADGRYRLGLTAGAGPSRAEQFFREDETLIGLVFTAVP